MLLTLAQSNFTVGDIEGNLNKIVDAYQSVKSEMGLFITSELALTGYYPQDLLIREEVLARQDAAIEYLLKISRKQQCALVIGAVLKNRSKKGKPLHNGLLVIHDGQVIFEYHKRLLPTYNVFDEARHFEPGQCDNIFEFNSRRFGVLICEDAWATSKVLNYSKDPVEDFKGHKLDAIICINASPNNLGKMQERYESIERVVGIAHAPVIYANQVGGNDELVFDGASFIMKKETSLALQMNAFVNQNSSIELENIADSDAARYQPEKYELIFNQLLLGIQDYVRKCGFSNVVIGSSGGIDSAVTIALCALALGSDKVTAITMPSKYSSSGSVTDSETLCQNLKVRLLHASIAEEFDVAVGQFKMMCGEDASNLTRENMQARIRGRILMEFSNHFGALVISTGNKSEMSVGYATLYGDMNGGVNPLGDLYKMDVYALARFINETFGAEKIPIAIIDKAPSAELSVDQKDSDSLPDYPLLDAVLKLYIEGDLLDDIEKQECLDVVLKYKASEEEISHIHRMVDRAEFKRRQAPPIIRVQKRSFGMGRWLPVAAKYI